MAPLLIIDPGHGGIDPGGGSNQLFKESEMVLRISLHQLQRFEELNIPVAITRRTSETLTSDHRAKLVRESGAKYCLSNHINSGGGRGSEMIYSIYASPALPKILGEELEAEGMPNRRVFTRTLPGRVDRDYYFMHRETGNVETVIIEYGFADNAADAQKINTDWRDLAEAVVRGFCEHTSHAYRPPASNPGDAGSETGAGSGGTGTTPGTGTNPGTGSAPPNWKQEAIDWLYQQGLLTDADWSKRADEPLPLWAEAVILRRLFEKLRG